MRPARVLIQMLFFPLPWPLRRQLLRWTFGYELHPKSRIGLSIVDVDTLRMGQDSRIGHFNIIHGLEHVDIGEASLVGKFNWISGAPTSGATIFLHEPGRKSILVVGREAAIVNWHMIDCADTVEFGPFSVLSGTGSQILTHGVEIEESRQKCAPVRIGAYTFVGTRCVILKGAQLADFCVIAAGSVCTFKTSEPYGLYGGVPAKRIRDLPKEAAFFNRSRGVVE